MTLPSHRLAGAPLDLAQLRADLGLPSDFPGDVSAEAAVAAGLDVAGLNLPDRTDLPLVTVDPPGSKDLDQALHVSADGDGYLVSYAIADVAAFVRPGAALDHETRKRGETIYFPDARVPLHPLALSENAASLLPGQDRPAVLWQIRLHVDGTVDSVEVARARVRSRAQLDYPGLQTALDAGTAPDAVRLLAEVGPLRRTLAQQRGAINLDLPEQEVQAAPRSSDGSSPGTGAGGEWALVLRRELPVEQWNAEMSLLTGMCAAQLMIDHGVGVLRTLPAPEPQAITRMRRVARALGVDWPEGVDVASVVAGLDRTEPGHVSFIEQAASLLRGAGYTAFDGTVPADRGHAGVGAPYAHVTAPLRRLVDRFGSSLCVALHAGQPVPDWVRDALPALPDIMRTADGLAHQVDRAVVDAVEAWVLQDRVGAMFDAVVLDVGKSSARIALDQVAVRATATGTGFVEGERTRVRLVAADVAARSVRFEAA